MPNFQDAKIYKIVNNNTILVYYGSTTQPLYKRFYTHKTIYSNCTSKKIFEGESPQIILVESYPCNNKDELRKRERFYIENNDCINKNIPGRTQKEYNKEHYQTNKYKLQDKAKEYYENNKDKLQEKKKEYYENNKDKILEHHKEYKLINKEKIKEKLKEKITCVCGSTITKGSKQKHIRTKKHQNYIKPPQQQ